MYDSYTLGKITCVGFVIFLKYYKNFTKPVFKYGVFVLKSNDISNSNGRD